LTRLLAAQQRGELEHHGPEAELMLGGLYLSYGQHRLAGEIFERVLEQSVDPALHDRAWYFLAKIWHQRGYLPEAEAALARIKGELPAELEPERQMLYAVGRLDPENPAFDALRDKANVALGYAWLQASRPVEAKPSLQRVRLDGPFSNKAL